MGLISAILSFFVGPDTRKTIEIFRENAELQAVRDHTGVTRAQGQFASEFALSNRSGFDRIIDAINRLPRPAMAFGVIGLFVAAMVDPDWFVGRMSGLAVVPDPLWWLLGAIVTFYFGARHQTKGAEYRQHFEKLANEPHPKTPVFNSTRNAAIDDWQANQ